MWNWFKYTTLLLKLIHTLVLNKFRFPVLSFFATNHGQAVNNTLLGIAMGYWNHINKICWFITKTTTSGHKYMQYMHLCTPLCNWVWAFRGLREESHISSITCVCAFSLRVTRLNAILGISLTRNRGWDLGRIVPPIYHASTFIGEESHICLSAGVLYANLEISLMKESGMESGTNQASYLPS